MNHSQAVMIVDDNPVNLGLMHTLLRPHYKTYVASSGSRALELLEQGNPVDLVLLDVMMPDMDGYTVCSRIKASPRFGSLPVVFLTAQGSQDEEVHGLAQGAVDFITKPVSPPLLLARVRNHIQHARTSALLREQNHLLEARVLERTRALESSNLELAHARDCTVIAMSILAEVHDGEAGNHIRRTQAYMRLLAEALADHPSHREALTPEMTELIVKAAPLHDIGKVGIPDHILVKPGPLTSAEQALMRRHTVLGRDALARVVSEGQQDSDFLCLGRDIAYSHHERWDGLGYPQGLQGEAIPLAARMMAVADVYDALISRRPYKQAWEHGDACAWILEMSGQAFDPDVVDAFARLAPAFEAVAMKFSDS